MTFKIISVGLLVAVGAFAQASKVAVSSDDSLTVYGGIQSGGSSDWQTIASTDILPPGGKDLLITVSMQSGLFDFTVDPAPYSILLQFSGMRVRVVIDGDEVNLPAPGAVTWDRQLNFLLEGGEASLDVNLKSGVRSFTFIQRNVSPATHHIEVQADFQFAAAEFVEGFAGSWAFITNRTLVVESVRTGD